MANTQITYRVLGENDCESVVQFIQKNFIPGEPVCCCQKIKAEDQKDFPHTIIKNALWQGVSIGAFDDKNNLCATRVNTLSKNENASENSDDNSKYSVEMLQIFKLLDTCKNDLRKYIGDEEYMEHTFVAVDKNYVRRGIASELYTRSEKLAVEHGCHKIFAVCTSYYTRLSTSKIGYQLMHEIFYEDYVDKETGKHLFANVKPPHKSVTLMMKTITPLI